jgi:hypothetical protein
MYFGIEYLPLLEIRIFEKWLIYNRYPIGPAQVLTTSLSRFSPVDLINL